MIVRILLWLLSLAALAGSALVAFLAMTFDPPMYLVLGASALGMVFAFVTNPLTSKLVGLWPRAGVISAIAIVCVVAAAGICFLALQQRMAGNQQRSDEMTAQMQANLTRSAIADTLNARRLPDEPENAFSPDSPEVIAIFDAADARAAEYTTQEGAEFTDDCFEAMLAIGADGDAYNSPTPEEEPDRYRANREALAFWFAVSEQTRPFGNSIAVAQRLDQIRSYVSAWTEDTVPAECLRGLP